MGAYIFQDDKSAAFLSCKLNNTQLMYTVDDKELLFIVMVLTEFHTMLLGAKLHICTDHLNITTKNIIPNYVICWLNYVEQFKPYIHFIPNVLADTMSQLDRLKEFVPSKGKHVLVLKNSI